MERGWTRREALKLGAIGAGALLVPSALRGWQRESLAHSHALSSWDIASPLVAPFETELALPPVLRPVRSNATTDFYEIPVRALRAEIIPGISTPVWGFNGISPGPTFRARIGRRIEATFINQLPADGDPSNIIIPGELDHHSQSHLSVHNHGINASQASDGYPEFTFGPGERYRYAWPNNSYQRPATLFYHDHTVHVTGEQLYRGLRGFYIISDEFEDSLPLPKGEFDVPLLISDVIVDPSGLLVYDNQGAHGVIGDVIVVNGRQQPRFEVANRKYRFRILNASDAREYILALSNDSPFWVIGSDHGLLARPEQRLSCALPRPSATRL